MKTTNAKTKAFQTPAGPAGDKDLDKTQLKPTSTRRPKPKISHAESVKLEIHGDKAGPLEGTDTEYAPPKPNDLPYKSEDFPDNALNYDALRPENLMRGWQTYYINPEDENGVTQREREFEEEQAKAFKATDDRILKAVFEEEWTVGDVPETFTALRRQKEDQQRKSKAREEAKKISTVPIKGPATIASRKAASALSVAPKSHVAPANKTTVSANVKSSSSFIARNKKPSPSLSVESSSMRHTAAEAASRSTIGYTKGRSASGVLNRSSRGLPRSASNVSTGSDITITPSRFVDGQASGGMSDEWRQLKLLGAFDTDDEDLEPGLRGALPECLRKDENSEQEFVLTLGS